MFNIHEKDQGVHKYPCYEVILTPELAEDDRPRDIKEFIDYMAKPKPKVGGGSPIFIFWPNFCAICLEEVNIYRKVTAKGDVYRCSDSEVTLEVQVPYYSKCKKKIGNFFLNYINRQESEAVSIDIRCSKDTSNPWGGLLLHKIVFKFRNPEYARRFVLGNSAIADDRHLREPEKKVTRKRKKVK